MLVSAIFKRKAVAFPVAVEKMMASTLVGEPTKKLLGKSAIVTASSAGIGFAIAKRLVLDGASVVVSSRQKKNVDAAVKSIEDYAKHVGAHGKVRGVVAHVAKAEDRSALIEDAFKAFGRLDILVSNAAVNPTFGPILETTEVVWDKIFEINVKNAFLLVKEAAPKLSASGSGSVVFVSSIAGYLPFKNLGAYCVSKTTLLGLTKVLAIELADQKIRVNSVCPGIVKTKFSRALWESEEVSSIMLQSIPLGRIAEADEIAGTVSFLSSQDASYITGENVVIAGGMPSKL